MLQLLAVAGCQLCSACSHIVMPLYVSLWYVTLLYTHSTQINVMLLAEKHVIQYYCCMQKGIYVYMQGKYIWNKYMTKSGMWPFRNLQAILVFLLQLLCNVYVWNLKSCIHKKKLNCLISTEHMAIASYS